MRTLILSVTAACLSTLSIAQQKPKVTLDEFFNSVSFPSVELSPDGNSVVIATDRADWDQQIFRKDLWLYRAGGPLIQLTQSGHDSNPKWSPDGRWIAFISDRKTESDTPSNDSDDSADTKEGADQLYLISPNGGEAFAITRGAEGVHAFSWSADSKTLYFATRNPWTKKQKDDYREHWKDVVEYRTSERGDTIFALDLATALNQHNASAGKTTSKADKEKEDESDVTAGSRAIALSPWFVSELVTSPDGAKLALMTNPINKRQEKFDDYEIYTVDLTNARPSNDPTKPALIEARQVTHNQAVETDLRWTNDSRHIYFTINVGDVSGPYRDLQPHLYWVDAEIGSVEQLGKDFVGPIEHYNVAAADVFASARLGTEVQVYSLPKPAQAFRQVSKWLGTYETISTVQHSPRIAFVYSSLQKPAEVYLADSPADLDHARPITSFNQLFTETRSAARQTLPLES